MSVAELAQIFRGMELVDVATVVTTSTNSIPRKIWASSATDIWITDLSAGQLYRGSPYLP